MTSKAIGGVIAVVIAVSLSACSGANGSGEGATSKEAKTFTATVKLKANLGPNASPTDFPDGGQCYGGDLPESLDLRKKQLQVLNSKGEIVGASAVGTGAVHRDADPWCGFTVTVSDVTAGSKLYTVRIDDMVSDAFTAEQLKKGDASFEVYKRQ
jgi:hypothetical protein